MAKSSSFHQALMDDAHSPLSFITEVGNGNAFSAVKVELFHMSLKQDFEDELCVN